MTEKYNSLAAVGDCCAGGILVQDNIVMLSDETVFS
jgi:hypothetical protein